MHPIYDLLSRIKFLSARYTFKFLFIAFLGIHIPLIGLIVFIVLHAGPVNTMVVLLLTLLLTLAATAITLFILKGLLSPLRASRETLQNYLTHRKQPALPVHYTDEAGLLMQHIQQTITELNDLLEEKEDLTALLSHDLRTPLHNVQTFATMLQAQQAHLNKEDLKDIADAILESTLEQQQLLNSVLEMLKMDYLFANGRQWKPFPVQPILEKTLRSYATAAAAKHITFQTDFQYTGTLQGQPELFIQVIKNLVNNALKFSYPHSQVKLVTYQKDNDVMIDVTDEGLGFEPAQAERLFDRFTKKGRKGTAGEPTTGIGLYLSRKIIKHQQGRLQAYSAGEGKGSTFTITLKQAF